MIVCIKGDIRGGLKIKLLGRVLVVIGYVGQDVLWLHRLLAFTVKEIINIVIIIIITWLVTIIILNIIINSTRGCVHVEHYEIISTGNSSSREGFNGSHGGFGGIGIENTVVNIVNKLD